MIKEIIVVEGKEDIRAVKDALNVEVIGTGGFAFSQRFIKMLIKLNEEKGIIIFTDPDYEGEKIRRRIADQVKGAKHAFLVQDKARNKDDIGIENASREDIIEAIKKAKPVKIDVVEEFTQKELLKLGLISGKNSRKIREDICEILGIGYCNSKQFLNRLNNFGVKREEFEEALNKINRKDD